jgi:hypothetical protein
MTELNNITALGPFTSVMNDPNINLNSLKEHGNLLIKYQTNLNLYLSSMINAYFAALNKVSASSKEENITSNEFRKIIINSFKDVFSSMFESSKKFNNNLIYKHSSVSRYADTENVDMRTCILSSIRRHSPTNTVSVVTRDNMTKECERSILIDFGMIYI